MILQTGLVVLFYFTAFQPTASRIPAIPSWEMFPDGDEVSVKEIWFKKCLQNLFKNNWFQPNFHHCFLLVFQVCLIMMVISAGVSLFFLVQFTCLICQGKRGHYVISFARRDPDDQMSHVEEISDIDNYQSSTILWIWKKNVRPFPSTLLWPKPYFDQNLTPIKTLLRPVLLDQ